VVLIAKQEKDANLTRRKTDEENTQRIAKNIIENSGYA
jgi:hypothetical protein